MEKLACRVLDGWRHGRHYLHHHCHSTDMAFSFKNLLVPPCLNLKYAPIPNYYTLFYQFFNPLLLLACTVKPQKWLILGPVICKNCHFQVTIKTIICEVLHGHLHHLQGMRTLNANRHLARFVTFEVVICEVLLFGNIWCPLVMSQMAKGMAACLEYSFE